MVRFVYSQLRSNKGTLYLLVSALILETSVHSVIYLTSCFSHFGFFDVKKTLKQSAKVPSSVSKCKKAVVCLMEKTHGLEKSVQV